MAPRPEGARCLVIASGALTTARLRNGTVHARFESALPGGGALDPGGEDGYTILDCICAADASGAPSTYFVIDVLSWRGHRVTECTAEFRLFWLASKLAELPAEAATRGLPRFRALPYAPATPEAIRGAHSGAGLDAQVDGLLFLHREAHYVPGSTPLALLWKDAACSRYFIDTDKDGAIIFLISCCSLRVLLARRVLWHLSPPFACPAGTILPALQMVLVYQMDGTVATGDDPSWVLGRLPVEFTQRLGGKLTPGTLLRFELGPQGFALAPDGKPSGADLRLLGAAGSRRGRADALSKVLFQHAARTAPLSLEVLLQSALEAAEAMTEA